MTTATADHPRLDGGLRLTYLMGRYPVLTETFIDREIQRLIDLGTDLAIVSIRRPDELLSPGQRDLSARVRYLLPASVRGLLRANLSALVRAPRTYFQTLAWLLSRPHPRGMRYRTALHFATGVYAAWVLRDRRGVHIHAHFIDRAATVALVASRLLGTTYSVTAHAQEIYVAPVLLRERISQAAFVATCTEYNRRHLAEVAGPHHAAKIRRLYHGLDLATYGDGAARAVGGDAPLILAVAQLTERKGLTYLVEACALLRDRGVAYCCEIVGDGPIRDELQAEVDRRRLSDLVVLTGPRPYPWVVERYTRAFAFVLPCIVTDNGDRDGIPNVILEAMAAGVPVVSSEVSGIPEVVHDGETGLLIPQRDADAVASAIARLLADPELRSRLGARASAFVRREFDLERNIGRLIGQFAAVTGSRILDA